MRNINTAEVNAIVLNKYSEMQLLPEHKLQSQPLTGRFLTRRVFFLFLFIS